jgi:hypothetical protein
LHQFVGIDWDNGEVKELEELTAASESRNMLYAVNKA